MSGYNFNFGAVGIGSVSSVNIRLNQSGRGYALAFATVVYAGIELPDMTINQTRNGQLYVRPATEQGKDGKWYSKYRDPQSGRNGDGPAWRVISQAVLAAYQQVAAQQQAQAIPQQAVPQQAVPQQSVLPFAPTQPAPQQAIPQQAVSQQAVQQPAPQPAPQVQPAQAAPQAQPAQPAQATQAKTWVPDW